MTKIAVFASGEGTNLQALLDACASGRIHGRVELVVSTSATTGAVSRARRAGVDVLILHHRDFTTPEEHNARLALECHRRGIGLICLAGFMCHIKKPLLEAFPWRILNIHPALLPSFGGKGMYGRKVHEAVIKSGVRVSGCTVHFVDEIYDHGWAVVQSAVPVLPSDTPESLAARVRVQEHWLYPRAVSLFCEGRLKIGDCGVDILPSPMPGSARVGRALVSVADKTGLAEFCRGLTEMGVEIVSTSGTAKNLEDAGIAVRPLDNLTGYPEILSGRVKTLHPSVHGAILFRRKDPAQAREIAALGIEPIDLIVVNLYPFARTAAGAPSPFGAEVIEQIDIGGVALIRAAAKNFEHVGVVVSPKDYGEVLQEMERSLGSLTLARRRRLAVSAFRHTAEYDSMISRCWEEALGTGPSPLGDLPQTFTLVLEKAQDLRYGENPHQKAALYRRAPQSFKQLHGKELSYNNLLDASAAWEAACEFTDPAAVIFKHATPSGIGLGQNIADAFQGAWACDPLSAFGGILAVNRPLDAAVARRLVERFVEVVVAPEFPPETLEIMRRKPNVRLLERRDPPPPLPVVRSLGAEVLVMEPDRATFGPALKIATRRAPTKEENEALRFAWTACKHVKSNAIVLAGPRATVGVGAGQMSRVDAVRLAAQKYEGFRKDNPAPPVLVLASDAFFPFPDSVELAAAAGVTAVIQPGGSVKDPEVIAAAESKGMAMVLTGMRHFRH